MQLYRKLFAEVINVKGIIGNIKYNDMTLNELCDDVLLEARITTQENLKNFLDIR